MAKINLLTIHWGNCYGAVMQTYATCQILKELGHKVTVINIIPKGSWKKYLDVKSWAFILLDYQFYKFKHRYFTSMTSKMHNIKKTLLPKADYTVVGSDQVWNRNITGYLAKEFYLNFLDDSDIRFSLASSFGTYKWEEETSFTRSVGDLLKKFRFISTREDSGVRICRDIFNLNAVQLIDPTLAYLNYSDLVTTHKEKKQIYVFLYHYTEKAKEVLDLLEKKLSIPIARSSIISKIIHSSPQDWLNNICNSNFIVTDSFHCLAFCILFKKQFAVICGNKSQFTRIDSLLTLLNLKNRIIETNEVEKIPDLCCSKINYISVFKILEQEANRYREFINNATRKEV